MSIKLQQHRVVLDRILETAEYSVNFKENLRKYSTLFAELQKI